MPWQYVHSPEGVQIRRSLDEAREAYTQIQLAARASEDNLGFAQAKYAEAVQELEKKSTAINNLLVEQGELQRQLIRSLSYFLGGSNPYH